MEDRDIARGLQHHGAHIEAQCIGLSQLGDQVGARDAGLAEGGIENLTSRIRSRSLCTACRSCRSLRIFAMTNCAPSRAEMAKVGWANSAKWWPDRRRQAASRWRPATKSKRSF